MKESGGPVDEKGNPLPLDNPEGGDPICPGGYKIDYDFDPFNDPINPPFRCISALIDPNDGKQYNNNINTSNQLQTDEDTIRGGSGRTATIRNIKKYRPTSYSKTRRRYQRHAS